MDGNTFRLTPPSEPISDLSVLDMSDELYVKDAEFGLTRCVTDADYAAWARRFGVSLVERAYEVAR